MGWLVNFFTLPSSLSEIASKGLITSTNFYENVPEYVPKNSPFLFELVEQLGIIFPLPLPTSPQILSLYTDIDSPQFISSRLSSPLDLLTSSVVLKMESMKDVHENDTMLIIPYLVPEIPPRKSLELWSLFSGNSQSVYSVFSRNFVFSVSQVCVFIVLFLLFCFYCYYFVKKKMENLK